jgi:hypothetical protein
MVGAIHLGEDQSRRVAAALLFPLSEPDQWQLIRQIIEPRKSQPSAAGFEKLEELVTD